MSEPPTRIDPSRHSRPAPWGLAARRGGIQVLAVFCALGLFNFFGQQPTGSTATAPAADLHVEAPSRLRSGLIGQFTVEVRAHRRIGAPRIVLGEGVVEGITINSVVPEAAGQAEDRGRLVLAFDPIPAGGSLLVRLQFQVNPVTAARRDQGVELRDGDEVLAAVARRVVIYP